MDASAAGYMEGKMKFCPLTRSLCQHSEIIEGKLSCVKAGNEPLAKLEICPLVKNPPEVDHLGI